MVQLVLHLGIWILSFGLVALGLIRVGDFTVAVAAAITVPIAALLSWVYARRATGQEIEISKRAGAIAGAITLGALLLYTAFPTYYLQGGRDHGVYAMFSIHASRTGGLNFDQPRLREIEKKFGDVAALSYPGLYSGFRRGLESDPAKLIPQFQHLFPAYGAAFHSLFGMEGVFRANGVLSAVAILFFFIISRILAGTVPALLAMAALAINPAVIWNARAPFTEMLSLWLAMMGTWMLLDSTRRPAAAAALAGAVLGAGVFARLDAGLNGLLILGGAAHLLFAGAKARTGHLIAASLAYIVISGLGFADGFVHSRPYFNDLWGDGSVKGLFLINFGAAGIALALGLSSRLRGFFTEARTVTWIRFAVIVLTGWYFFHYFVLAPIDHAFNGRSIHELGWYVTPLAYVLAPFAMLTVLKRPDWHRWAPFILFLGFTSFAYLVKPSITPDHFWASRRWLPHVIPLFLLFSAFGLSELYGIARRRMTHRKSLALTAFVPAMTYLLVSLGATHPFLFKSLLDDQLQEYQAFAERLKAAGPMPEYYLTSHIQVASILNYVYGIPTVLLAPKELRRINQRTLEGHHFIGIDPSANDYEKVVQGQLDGLYTERLPEKRPRRLIRDRNHLSAGKLVRIRKGIW